MAESSFVRMNTTYDRETLDRIKQYAELMGLSVQAAVRVLLTSGLAVELAGAQQRSEALRSVSNATPWQGYPPSPQGYSPQGHQET